MGTYNGLGGFSCSRTTLIVLNVVYVIVGCVLIALAASGKALSYIADLAIMGGIIACGVFLLLIAIAGLVGTVLHHQVTLFFYMSILFLLFIVQFVVACACLAITPPEQRNLIEKTWNSSDSAQRVTVQKIFDCCGGKGNDEYNLVEDQIYRCGNTTSKCCQNERTKNASCCTGHWNETIVATVTCPCDVCIVVVERVVSNVIKAAGGVGLFFSFTELIGVWLAFRFRNLKNPYANPSDFL